MRERIYGLDLLRIVSVFAVICIHSIDTSLFLNSLSPLLQFAVPAFIVMSVFLALESMSNQNTTFQSWITKWLNRLYRPFLFWTSLYLCSRILKAIFITKQPIAFNWVSTYLGGSVTHHLWFVPFLLYSLVLLFPYFRVVLSSQKKIFFMLVSLILGGVIYCANIFFENNIDLPVGIVKLSLKYLGYVFVSVGLWAGYKEEIFKFRGRTALLCLNLLLVVGSCLTYSSLVYEIFYVVPLVLIALNYGPSYLSDRLMGVSSVSFGIYFIHVLFIESIQTFFNFVNAPIQGVAATLLLILFVYLGSLFTANVLNSSRLSKWTVM